MRAVTVFTFTVLGLAVCAIMCFLIRDSGGNGLDPEALEAFFLMAAPYVAIGLLAWAMRERPPVAVAIFIATLVTAGLGTLLVGGSRIGTPDCPISVAVLALWSLAAFVLVTALVVNGFYRLSRRDRPTKEDGQPDPDGPRHQD